MPTPTIYRITNTKNDKIYVGSAINFIKRKNNHLYYLRKDNHCNLHLQRAYNAYGEENFRWEIIEYLDDVNKLIEREQYWIDILDACNENIGYNLYPIAGSPLGHICSEETKEKMRNIFKGKPLLEETKEKMKKASIGKNKGVKKTEEHKANISKSQKGKKLSKEHIYNIKNRVISKETRKKISESKKVEVTNLTTGEIFSSMTEAANAYGVSRPSISSACRGLSKYSANCRWSY